MDVVDPSPALKQLMHEADHLSLFSAEITDQCSCSCASPECLRGVATDNLTFCLCFGGMTAISMRWNSVPQKMRVVCSHETSVSSYSTALCQNTECCYMTISIEHGSLETPVHVGVPSV